MTKPVDFPELYKVFDKIKFMLDEEQQETMNNIAYHRLLNNRYFNNIVRGLTEEEPKIIESIGWPENHIKPDSFIVLRTVMLRPNSLAAELSQNETDEISQGIDSLLSRFGSSYTFNNVRNEVTTLLFFSGSCFKIEQILEAMKNELIEIAKYNFYIGASKTFLGSDNVQQAYL